MHNDYRLGLYEKSMPENFSLCKKLETTKKFGFDYLDLSIDETDEKLARLNWSKIERRTLIKNIFEIGVPIGSICLSAHRKYSLGNPDVQKQKKAVQIMERAAELASDLGVRIIHLAGYDVYYEESTEQTRKDFEINLRKCVGIAAKHGVILAFENMENTFMDKIEKCMTFISKINSPYLQMYPDLGNTTNAARLYGNTVEQDMLTANGRLVALHLKETDEGRFRDMEYGFGWVDFAQGINIAWELGVRRFVTEFWDNGDHENQIKHAHDFIRPKIDAAGRRHCQ
ncbi:MAG: L-ribulose-5-phosphate 3-epimerase [Oscillospiraceae bacterium]|nr:L-ribulose-5-phosphate 3-epimerase [Oscillospiraceae bacterium]